ncbi:MAG: hypothetical protein IT465_08280 [Moraxellaceae bacterium]|nr:hypothetical protein [Moraxellaceae bacterium]
MTRWKASFIHLIISFFVVGTVAAYIIYFWYPLPLMHMAKADQLLLMIGGIDLIVGPLLTLLVYKHGKKTLRMDLTVIAVIQAVFLSMGLYTMFQSRPVFLVATSKRFDMIFVNEIDPTRLSQAKIEKFKTLSFTKPLLVGAKFPTNIEEKTNIIMSALSGAGDIQTMPEYYVEYQELVPDILANSAPLQLSAVISEQSLAVMQEAAQHYGYQPSDVRYMNLGSARGFAVMLIDAKTGQVVGPVNLDL